VQQKSMLVFKIWETCFFLFFRLLSKFLVIFKKIPHIYVLFFSIVFWLQLFARTITNHQYQIKSYTIVFGGKDFGGKTHIYKKRTIFGLHVKTVANSEIWSTPWEKNAKNTTKELETFETFLANLCQFFCFKLP